VDDDDDSDGRIVVEWKIRVRVVMTKVLYLLMLDEREVSRFLNHYFDDILVNVFDRIINMDNV
jgi:hypothetical protein